MRLLPLAVLTAATALVAAPAASAAEASCAKTATVTSGAQDVTAFHAEAPPEGEPLQGKTLRRGGHFYRTDGPVRIRLAGNRYRVAGGAIFKLGCWGPSRAEGARYPLVDLMTGSVKVRTARAEPGGVSTSEGLYDPRSDRTIRFTVTRELARKGEPSMDEIFAWYGYTVSQPDGTTKVDLQRGKLVGVTPYVGPQPGRCVYCKRAELRSNGGKGRVEYDRA